MFTGIVESTGTLNAVAPGAAGVRLRIDLGPLAAGTVLGASISVAGVCLTVAAISGAQAEFDVIPETISRTTLGERKPGDRVNLERALRVGDRLDGHFVQGHVDGTAEVVRVVSDGRERVVFLTPEEPLIPYLVPKGSVTIDGVSLTIAHVGEGSFSVALIPTTLERTTLAMLQLGDRVNIESDIIARTVVHHLSGAGAARGLTLERLQAAGFA